MQVSFSYSFLDIWQEIGSDAKRRGRNAVIGLDGFYQHVSQSALPESEHILILAAGQLNMSLHPIGENAVQWAKQAIEERGDPKSLLGKLQVFGFQGLSLQVLIGLSVIPIFNLRRSQG